MLTTRALNDELLPRPVMPNPRRHLITIATSMAMLLTIVAFVRPVDAQSVPKERSVNKSKPARTKETPAVARINEYSSKNFVLRTDLSPDDAKELLTRLETMLVLVAKYFGKPNSQIIEMNVVKDQASWPPGSIDPDAIASIQTGGGITLSVTQFQRSGTGQKQAVAAKSIVWAVADRGTPQHEAVHAYCHQSFGRTGPTWYSEGMAELGQYWRERRIGATSMKGACDI